MVRPDCWDETPECGKPTGPEYTVDTRLRVSGESTVELLNAVEVAGEYQVTVDVAEGGSTTHEWDVTTETTGLTVTLGGDGDPTIPSQGAS